MNLDVEIDLRILIFGLLMGLRYLYVRVCLVEYDFFSYCMFGECLSFWILMKSIY